MTSSDGRGEREASLTSGPNVGEVLFVLALEQCVIGHASTATIKCAVLMEAENGMEGKFSNIGVTEFDAKNDSLVLHLVLEAR